MAMFCSYSPPLSSFAVTDDSYSPFLCPSQEHKYTGNNEVMAGFYLLGGG